MERREFQRLDLRLTLFYRTLDRGDIFRSNSINISEGGLRLALQDSTDVNQFLEIRIILPYHKIVDVVGRVVWFKDIDTQEAGVQILDKNEIYRNRIKELFKTHSH